MDDMQESPKLRCRWDDLAVPEVLTGALEGADIPLDEPEEEGICYDDLAVPEIRAKLICVTPKESE